HAATAVICMGIGAYLGFRYGAEGVVRLAAIALAIAMVSSLLVMILLPRWGTMVLIHPGAWLGVFAHKNALGMMSLLAILCFAYLARESQGGARRGWLGLIVVALILLLGSGSMTAIVGLAVMAGFAFALRVFRRSTGDL